MDRVGAPLHCDHYRLSKHGGCKIGQVRVEYGLGLFLERLCLALREARKSNLWVDGSL